MLLDLVRQVFSYLDKGGLGDVVLDVLRQPTAGRGELLEPGSQRCCSVRYWLTEEEKELGRAEPGEETMVEQGLDGDKRGPHLAFGVGSWPGKAVKEDDAPVPLAEDWEPAAEVLLHQVVLGLCMRLAGPLGGLRTSQRRHVVH